PIQSRYIVRVEITRRSNAGNRVALARANFVESRGCSGSIRRCGSYPLRELDAAIRSHQLGRAFQLDATVPRLQLGHVDTGSIRDTLPVFTRRNGNQPRCLTSLGRDALD